MEIFVAINTILIVGILIAISIPLFKKRKIEDEVKRLLDNELRSGREEQRNAGKELREEIAKILKEVGEGLNSSSESTWRKQQERLEKIESQLGEMNKSNIQSLEKIRSLLDDKLETLQKSNEEKLDQMRKTVDEKLHDTLEKRLGESFKLVGERLESVHKGLGEMQNLATGVGDLKRVLTNVKARGTWAEVQLGAILEQVLTVDQFEKNVRVNPNTSAIVEFAIRLPGPDDTPETFVYLPIDSKYPQEDYAKLQDASDSSDIDAVQSARKSLFSSIRNSAKEVSSKYVCPPHTTDFAIMFLATEGLYAEVLSNQRLVEELQLNYRIVVTGPTTLVATLNSLRVGFQTLAIEKRASEVWRVLAAVKTEFGKFGDVLTKVKKQLGTASRTLDESEVRTRAMQRTLRSVENLSETDVAEVFSIETEKPD